MYLKHSDLSKYWIIDCETDDLQATRIWVVVATNAATSQTEVFTERETFNRFVRANAGCYWVGHNAISFDVPTLNRLWSSGIDLGRVVDTLVLSYLYDPHMPGGHSLERWGERLGFAKLEFHDFNEYSERMLEYCKRDVALTLRVFKALTRRMAKRGFSEKSCEIEHRIRVVIDKQERNGFYFNIPGAEALYNQLRNREAELGGPIKKLFPPVLKEQGRYKFRIKADGEPYGSYARHVSQFPHIEHWDDGTYSTYDYQEFNIGSPAQRLEKLLSLGFKPTKKTKTGNPSVDEDSLVEFARKTGMPEIQAIADWLVVNGRANMIGTWLNNVNREDSRMHGRVLTCGALTRRMTHSSPNTANIPKASDKVPYGKECRSLWTVEDRERRRLVGYDAAGLEMRMFAHYLGDPEVANLYIYGDPHQANADLLDIDRSTVKNVFYAFLYGATNATLGITANNRKASWGKLAREQLTEKTPGLRELVELVQAEQVSGFLETIDGGYVRCHSPHAALNSKLQSAGGILMKVTSILLDEEAEKAGIDHMKVGDIHDEGQHDVAVDDATRLGELAVACLRNAGEELNISVPIDGEFKVGFTWAETH